jgi:hypothetical protein
LTSSGQEERKARLRAITDIPYASILTFPQRGKELDL